MIKISRFLTNFTVTFATKTVSYRMNHTRWTNVTVNRDAYETKTNHLNYTFFATSRTISKSLSVELISFYSLSLTVWNRLLSPFLTVTEILREVPCLLYPRAIIIFRSCKIRENNELAWDSLGNTLIIGGAWRNQFSDWRYKEE